MQSVSTPPDSALPILAPAASFSSANPASVNGCMTNSTRAVANPEGETRSELRNAPQCQTPHHTFKVNTPAFR